jgi:TolB-like protein/Tfp pilus assembly protein PilF
MSGSFITEMKRRNVFRVAAIYVVVGWLLIQIGDVMFPALYLPEWTTTMLVAFLILGLPVALILAWAYEVTPDGVVRTADVPPGQSITPATGQKINFMIIGVLAIAVVFLLAKDRIFDSTVVAPEITVSESSIAILPFKNLSASVENAEFFANGLHDELLTLLSRLRDLKVISRTSVERVDPALGIPEIGKLLGVATILEGQVQRAGDRLRINVQLIDTVEEGHIWANTYDSELTAENIFEVQGDIARTISEALQAELSTADEEILNAVPTANTEALEYYLLGMQLAKRNTYSSLKEAQTYLRKATRLDPNYAQAWAELANVLGDSMDTGVISAREYIDTARPNIDRALALDPTLAVAHAQLAKLQWILGDVKAAEGSFNEALRLNLNDAASREMYGVFLRVIGRLDEAAVVLEKALEGDPLSVRLLFQLGKVEMYRGYPERNLARAKRILELDPSSAYGYTAMMQAHLWMGRQDLSWEWFVKSLEVDPLDFEMWAHTAMLLEQVGDPDLADRYMTKAESLGRNEPSVLKCRALIHVRRGEPEQALVIAENALAAGMNDRWGSNQVFLKIYRDHAFDTGEFDGAFTHYRNVKPELFDDAPEISAENVAFATDLALLHQRVGNDAAAQLLIDAALTWWRETQTEGVHGSVLNIVDIELLALNGQHREALNELRRAADAGWRNYWSWIVPGENLAALRDEPELKALDERIKNEFAEQLQTIYAYPYLGEADLRDRNQEQEIP